MTDEAFNIYERKLRWMEKAQAEEKELKMKILVIVLVLIVLFFLG